ncbi:hypothetical protein JKP88DRAFT_135109, partial [Tribonema minus]
RDPACGYDFIRGKNEEAGGNEGDFLSRMDAQTAHSRRKLEERRAEEAYNDRQDKKSCPQCGAVQSYDEYAKKKTKCAGCGATYSSATAWSRGTWNARNAAVAARSNQRMAQLQQRVDAETRGLSALGQQQQVRRFRQAELLKQRAARQPFIDRMEADVGKRER